MQVTRLLKAIERHHCVLLSLDMTHFQNWNASSYVVVSQTPRAFCWSSVTGKSHVSWREKLKFVTLQLLPSLFVTCLVQEHRLTKCCFLFWRMSTLQKQHVPDSPSRTPGSFLLSQWGDRSCHPALQQHVSSAEWVPRHVQSQWGFAAPPKINLIIIQGICTPVCGLL